MNQGFVGGVIDRLALVSDFLLPFMVGVFFIGVITRGLIYFTVKRELWFVKEFEKRLQKFMEFEHPSGALSFYVTLKRILEKSFYELFEVRSTMRRRRFDNVSAPSDRIFLIQQGSAFLVRDTLKNIAFLKKSNNDSQNFLDVSKRVMQENPCFTRIFGVVSAAPINDFLNLLPGLFVVGGIFGTFLGIMKSLPDLGGMDLNDPTGTKAVMDTFLLRVAFSMATSTVGIACSLALQVFNSFINPDRLFVEIVARYEQNLALLWKRCDNNDVPLEITEFDEHKDPAVGLAELSVQKELSHANDKVSKDPRKHAVPPKEPPVRGPATEIKKAS